MTIEESVRAYRAALAEEKLRLAEVGKIGEELMAMPEAKRRGMVITEREFDGILRLSAAEMDDWRRMELAAAAVQFGSALQRAAPRHHYYADTFAMWFNEAGGVMALNLAMAYAP